MSYLLAIETAATSCSVALFEGDALLMESALHRARSHSERLVPMIEHVLESCSAEQLDAVAVSSGPGSYTGLRIGVSTAKGLAMAYGAKLVGVPTLMALAEEARPMASEGDAIGAFLRARRSEWYASAYQIEENRLSPLGEPAVITDEELHDWIGRIEPSGSIWAVSDREALLRPLLNGLPVRLLPPEVARLSARSVGRQGLLRLQQGQMEDVARFEPFYLRPYRAKKSTSALTGN